MKKGLYLLIVLVVFMCPSIVKAATTTTATCSYSDKAELNKMAYNVTANYTLNYDEENNPSFNISIYNITGDLYVEIKSDNREGYGDVIHPNETKGGVFTFNDATIDKIVTYTITVRSSRKGCIQDIRKFSVVKPMKNPYFELDICQYSGMEDYYYCREWITARYTITEDKIRARIEDELAKVKSTGATRCLSCEEEVLQAKAREEFLEMKSLVLKILVVLIVVNVIALIFFYQRARSYDL